MNALYRQREALIQQGRRARGKDRWERMKVTSPHREGRRKERVNAMPSKKTTGRQCRGIPKLGVQPHKTPPERFGKSAASADGLQPLCKPCDKAYQEAWRQAKDTGKWPTPEEVQRAALEHRKRFGKPKPRKADSGVLTPKDGTEAQAAEGAAFEKELERVGPETEEGQAMLRAAAEDSARARREARNARRRELRRLAKEREQQEVA